mmetsp:Transcript_26366/g.87393  ORF Transcript_26366/g.87393 Transcript_26366/m.87393 type:complete len:220 (-) Transcript_26366:1012-1671(-)
MPTDSGLITKRSLWWTSSWRSWAESILPWVVGTIPPTGLQIRHRSPCSMAKITRTRGSKTSSTSVPMQTCLIAVRSPGCLGRTSSAFFSVARLVILLGIASSVGTMRSRSARSTPATPRLCFSGRLRSATTRCWIGRLRRRMVVGRHRKGDSRSASCRWCARCAAGVPAQGRSPPHMRRIATCFRMRSASSTSRTSFSLRAWMATSPWATVWPRLCIGA